MKTEEGIIFFDGVCGLCNGFVDFIMSIDKGEKFKFSPLQSDFARAQLPPELVTNLNSVAVKVDGQVLTKSAAVMKVLSILGGVWGVLSIARYLPTGLRDSVYDLVAEHRYKIFGKKESCRLPTPEERKRFVL